jgi:hypothetical protein
LTVTDGATKLEGALDLFLTVTAKPLGFLYATQNSMPLWHQTGRFDPLRGAAGQMPQVFQVIGSSSRAGGIGGKGPWRARGAGIGNQLEDAYASVLSTVFATQVATSAGNGQENSARRGNKEARQTTPAASQSVRSFSV